MPTAAKESTLFVKELTEPTLLILALSLILAYPTLASPLNRSKRYSSPHLVLACLVDLPSRFLFPALSSTQASASKP